MSHAVGFWSASAILLFVLSCLWFHQKLHSFNPCFTAWLALGVLMQVIAAWWLCGGRPAWVVQLRIVLDGITYALAALCLVVALLRRDPVNQIVLAGLGGMLFFNLLARGLSANQNLGIWLRNIAFFGPALFLLLAFSTIRFNRLPLTLQHSSVLKSMVCAATSVTS
jgi:hypothetical protein